MATNGQQRTMNAWTYADTMAQIAAMRASLIARIADLRPVIAERVRDACVCAFNTAIESLRPPYGPSPALALPDDDDNVGPDNLVQRCLFAITLPTVFVFIRQCAPDLSVDAQWAVHASLRPVYAAAVADLCTDVRARGFWNLEAGWQGDQLVVTVHENRVGQQGATAADIETTTAEYLTRTYLQRYARARPTPLTTASAAPATVVVQQTPERPPMLAVDPDSDSDGGAAPADR